MFKRNGVWWTCIRYNGKKIQKSLDTSDKKLAKSIEAKVKTEIVEEHYFGKPLGCKKTVKDMIQKLIKEHAPKLSVSMQRSYLSYSIHLLAFLGNSQLINLSPKKISRYKVTRREEGAKPATINRELAMLSKAFNLAVREWEWIHENPVSKVPKEKENNKRDRWLKHEEERRILELSPEYLREIIIFALNTGLRQDELLSLEWDRVSLIRRTILIQKTKSARPRTIPLNKTA